MTEPAQRKSVERPFGPEVVLFCGGRDCTMESHGDMIRSDIFGLREGSVVLHGGQRGADLIADFWARSHARTKKLHIASVEALWGAHGKKAGPMRNKAMLMLGPTFAFAYPTGGPGTNGMLALLRQAGIDHIIREASVRA